MSKFLIMSDLHIHDFTHHNLFNDKDFRLNQFITLAHRVIEIALENNCDYLVLAGDITHRPLINSKVGHIISEFFKILHKNFNKDHLFYILGQHDLNTKTQEQNYNDSLIHIITEHASYMNKKIISLDNHTIAFNNWQPIQDFSFIETPVDLLIGHVTLSTMFGQDIDDTKYKLGIFGDIHNPVTIGHSHSINVPIQHHISDSTEGSVVVINIDTMDWKRVLVDEDSSRFLRIYYDDVIPSKFIDNKFCVQVTRPTAAVNMEYVHRSIDLDVVISDIVNAADVKEIHSEVTTLIDRTGTEPLNLNFKINTVNIQNFRSIKKYIYTAICGITAITGYNGSGKSSLMQAINYAFRPPKSSRNLTNKNSNSLKITMDLDYNGRNHVFSRSIEGASGSLDYFVNGEAIPATSITERNDILNTNLPFINIFDILYRSQGAPYLLSDYGYADRIELINKILGLGIIDRYFQSSNTILKSKKNLISELDDKLLKQSGIIEGLSDNFELINECIHTENQIELYFRKISECDMVQDLYKSIDKYTSKLNINIDFTAINKIDNLNLELDNYSKSYDAIVDYIIILTKFNSLSEKLEMTINLKDHYSYDIKMIEDISFISSLDNKIEEHKLVIKTNQLSMTKLIMQQQKDNSSIDNTKIKIQELYNSINKVNTICPSCKRALDSSDYENVINHINDEIKTLNISLEILVKELNDNLYESNINQLGKENYDLTEKLNELVNSKKSIDQNISNYNKYNEISKEIEKLKLDIIPLKSELNNFILYNFPKDTITCSTIKINLNTEISNIKTKIIGLRELSVQYEQYKLDKKELEVLELTLIDMKINDNLSRLNISKTAELLDEKLNEYKSLLIMIKIMEDKYAKYCIAIDISEQLKTEIETLNNIYNMHKKYTQLFHPTGSVIKSIYLQVSQLLTDNNIRVNTIRKLASGEERIDFSVEMKVGDWWINYDDCSGGQKILIDIFFMTRLFKISGRVGILILDETLKDLDNVNLEYVAKLINDAPINNVLLSTHVESFNYYDQKLQVQLNVDGYSDYSYEAGM